MFQAAWATRWRRGDPQAVGPSKPCPSWHSWQCPARNNSEARWYQWPQWVSNRQRSPILKPLNEPSTVGFSCRPKKFYSKPEWIRQNCAKKVNIDVVNPSHHPNHCSSNEPHFFPGEASMIPSISIVPSSSKAAANASWRDDTYCYWFGNHWLIFVGIEISCWIPIDQLDFTSPTHLPNWSRGTMGDLRFCNHLFNLFASICHWRRWFEWFDRSHLSRLGATATTEPSVFQNCHSSA